MRRRIWLVCGAGAVVVLVGVLALGHVMQVRERHILVTRDTTFVSRPVDALGYVDYFAATNAEFSTGVTKENNAAVLLLKAIGFRAVMSTKSRAAVLMSLGLKAEEVPEKGYVTFSEMMPEREGESSDNRANRLWNQESLRMKKPWREEDDPDVTAWIKRNEGALGLTKEASLRDRYFWPLMDKGEMECLVDMELPALGTERELANMMATSVPSSLI
jgi:hypothetical protein